MAVCFLISPIGDSGSEIRQNADDLRDLIIKPVMGLYGITVLRGDHRSEVGQIDVDVIRAVQESDLCIVDLSLPNPNVYYEFGRRDETGKPLIILKAKDSGELPVDVATRRYIEYDLDSRRGLIEAQEKLKEALNPLVEKGFESNGTGASLSELAEILRRVERKVDRLKERRGSDVSLTEEEVTESGASPSDMLKYAIMQRNIPAAERAMEQLSYRMNKHQWLDKIVEVVAGIGSVLAGDILIDNAVAFMDDATSYQEKIDFIEYLVSNLNSTDRELENLELFEQLCATVLEEAKRSNDNEARISIHNALNRLYHGIYVTTKELLWIEKAINELQQALKINNEAGYLHYNLSLCLKERNVGDDMRQALQHIEVCVNLDEKPDDDHLAVACEITHALNDERLDDYFSRLEQVNRIKAEVLKKRLGL